MKKSWTFISLVAALAVGSASAQAAPTPSTPAGTKIVNQAEITFTPENGNGSSTVPSNPVETVVLPVPSFTITPNDGSADVSKPDYTKPGLTEANIKPCDKNVSFKYVLTNTGNVPNESYTLTNTPDPTGAVKTPENIRFYPVSADTNNDGKLSSAEVAASKPITEISGVGIGQAVTFFQVYDIPCSATDKDKFGGDPTGERKPNSGFPNAPTLPKDANNSNTVVINRNDGVLIGPKDDADGNQNPTTKPYPSTDTKPTTIYPGGNTLPGGTTPVADDTQVAIGQCSASTSVVTFTNTVRNTGNSNDVFNISTSNTLPAGSTVQLLDSATGAPLADSNGDGKPDVGSLEPGKEKSVLVRVTYSLPCDKPVKDNAPAVTVVATSSNDPSKSDPTKDIILFPGLSFGDPTPTPGGDPTPIGTPPKGTPGHPDSPVEIPANCVNPIPTFMPMEIANLGAVADLYNITGTAPIKLTDGTTLTTTVKYLKDVNGDGKLDAGDTVLVDTNGDNIPDTGLLKPGEEMKLIAVVDVPCKAAAQTVTLNQSAKSPNTGVEIKDTNNQIVIGKSPVAAPVKTVDKKEAKPGETLTYTIVGKNTSNANITKPYICDALPMNTSFESLSAVSDATTKILYSKDGGGTWSAAPITTGVTNGTATALGSKLCAGVDTNGDGQLTTADLLKPGESITVTLKVKVN